MPVSSLSESLNRLKATWKLRIGSNNSSSSHNKTANPASSALVSDIPRADTQSGRVLMVDSELLCSTRFPGDEQPENKKSAWPVMKSLLAALEAGTEAVGPLRAAIGRLNRCVDIFESANHGCREYEELRAKIEGVLADLAKHMIPPTDLEITSSVKRICADIEHELRSVEEVQARSTGRRLVDAMAGSDDILESYNRIHGHLERLTLNATMDILKLINKQTTEVRLAGLLPAKAAVYNSAEAYDLKRGSCTPGTREPQIKLLLDWASNPESGNTCWMNGMAGTGKTTIAYTVCAELHKTYELGASFFCSRTIPECRQVKYILPSIAYQLARFSLPFQCALVSILQFDPDVYSLEPKVQYQKLIVEPLQKVRKSLPTDFIVVIDALDECENERSVGQVLDLLMSPKSILPIRFLVSSRPEPEIYRRMMGQLNKPSDPLLVLHNLDSYSVKADIETYVRRELDHIPLTGDQLAGLMERCGVLFIYASTTCRYIEQAHRMMILDEALSSILGSASVSTGSGHEKAIDGLYFTILTAAFNTFSGFPQMNNRMQALLETVICAMEPLTLEALADMLYLGSANKVDALLQPLRSVLNVTKTTGLVTTLHVSFPDFLLSTARARSFHCRHSTRHMEMAKSCLRMIDAVEPKVNICRLDSSYLLDEEVENLNERVSHAISPGIIYACQHWSTHLSMGQYGGELVDLVGNFLFSRLLVWLEILNLTKRKRYGTSIIQKAEIWCSKHASCGDEAKLAHDAWQFVSMFANHPVSRSTPHIYVSMLPFWPASRPISKAYMARTVGMIQPTGTAITRRPLALLATWDVAPPRDKSYSMSVSEDGTRLAVTTEHGIVVLDTITGESILSLSEEDNVLSIAISPDGTKITFGLSSGVIKHWDIRNEDRVTELLPCKIWDSGIQSMAVLSDRGRVAICLNSGDIYIYSLLHKEHVHGPLKGHTDYVCSIAFSPDGSYLASGSRDHTVRIWDTTTGHMVGSALQGHTDWVRSVSYSPNGSHLASASHDGTIRVWDPQTGQTVLGPLKGHSDWVRSVACSPDGCFIASGSDDKTIRVYNAQTGQIVLGPLQGHTNSVNSVVFSPDNSRLFSRSDDGTIRVWNVLDLDSPDVPLPSPSFSSHILSIRYSHGGSCIVSGLQDGTVHVWDVQAGNMVLGPLHGHTDWIRSLDYSRNDAYIASASEDGTLRIWDASNGNDIHGPIHGHVGRVNCVRFSPDSSVLASGSSDGTVRIWSATSGQPVMTLVEGNDPILSIGFSPVGQQLVSGSENGCLQVLDRQTGETVISPHQAHRRTITSVEFSPDGLCILSSSWNRHIHMWDVQSEQQTLVRREPSLEHEDAVLSASFSPDGRFIVSGSAGGTVHVWDAETGNLVLGPLEGHNDYVRCAQFSPDGSHVVSCSPESIRFWDVSSCTTITQGSFDQDEGGTHALSQGVDNTLGPWSMGKDGWVVDRRGRRLVWVPSDLHTHLRRPLNDGIITDEPWFKVAFDRTLTGEGWAGCYRP